MKILISALLLACFLVAPAMALPESSVALPVVTDLTQDVPLYKYRDSKLQSKLQAEIASNPQWKRLVDKKKMAVAVVDITDPTQPLYAALNGEITMYAASLPKIAILLAAFQRIHDGRLEDTPALREDMNAMIRVSSNTAATNTIAAVGGLEGVNEVLTGPQYKLYDKKHGGGLWVGKRYAKTGGRVGDPMKNISHAASVMQVARFYYLLSTGRLVSPEASAEMLQILSAPGIHHKFVASLDGEVDGEHVYRKSGTWRNYHADSVLVWAPDWRQYILVGIVQSDDGGQILKDLVHVAEKALQTNK